MKKTIKTTAIVFTTLFVLFAAGSIVLSSAVNTPDKQAKTMAAALAPEKTAKRIEAIYHERGERGHVTCVDFSATEQRCKVTRNGRTLVRLNAKIDMATGNVDIRPAS